MGYIAIVGVENMIPSIYLIKSEEHSGLVKIGFTKSDVKNRVEQYKTGISHKSVVYQTFGHQLFEKYFHEFFDTYQKPVSIRFKSLGSEDNGFKPKEWFNFEPQPHILAILIEAFEQELPQTIEDIDEKNLPIFLSGLLSAIDWDAREVSVDRQVERAQLLELRDSLISDEQQNKRIESDSQMENMLPEQGEGGTYSSDSIRNIEDETMPSLGNMTAPSSSFSQYIAKSEKDKQALRRERATLKDDIEKIKELQNSRTVIAILSAICVLYLWRVGGEIEGVAIFAFIAFASFAIWGIWGKIYYRMADATEKILYWIKNTTDRFEWRGDRDEQ